MYSASAFKLISTMVVIFSSLSLVVDYSIDHATLLFHVNLYKNWRTQSEISSI